MPESFLNYLTIITPTFFLFWFLFSKYVYVGMYYNDFPNFLQNKWIMAALWILRVSLLALFSWFLTVTIFRINFMLKKRIKLLVLALLFFVIPIIFLILSYQDFKEKNGITDITTLSVSPANSKVVLLGLDGAEWEMINRLVKEGLLPNFEWLIKQGNYGRLKTINYESPGIWTSIATGIDPRSHGIYKHTQFNFSGMKEKVQAPYYLAINAFIPKLFKKFNFRLFKTSLITSDKRDVPAIWNILSFKERKNIVVNWLATHPVEPISGLMVSSRIFDYLSKSESDKSDIKRYYYSSPIIKQTVISLENKDLGSVVTNDQYYSELALDLMRENKDIDLFMVYLGNIDPTSHLYWRYMESDKFFFVDKKKLDEHKHSIEQEYIEKDRFIGEVVKNLDEEHSLIICSDHGFGPALFENKHSGGHFNCPDGVFIAYGDIFKKNFEINDVSIYDICPTILYILGFPVARDMPGKVIRQAFATQSIDDVSYISTYGRRNLKRVADKDESFEKELERLKSLGYIR